jgi:hypothetical protein
VFRRLAIVDVNFARVKLWWELVIVLVILKIPVFYVGWVLWWAIKAVPELGTEGGADSINWAPWRRPPAANGSPVRSGRGAHRRARPHERSREARREARMKGVTHEP